MNKKLYIFAMTPLMFVGFLFGQQDESKKNLVQKPKADTQAVHENGFTWRKTKSLEGGQMEGFLNSERVASAVQTEKNGIYEVQFIYIENKTLATITVSKVGQSYSHALSFNDLGTYKAKIVFNEDENTSYIRFFDINNKLVRIIKICPKSNLVTVGPVNDKVPW